MRSASSRGPSRRSRSPRSRAASALAAAAAASIAVLSAASLAAAQAAPPLGYSYGVWPTPTRLDGSAEIAATPAPPAPDAVTPSEAKKEGSGASFDLGCATEVPLMVGAQATLELPYRFLVQGEVGVLPAAYVNAIDGVLTGTGAYDATTSALVRSTLQNSLVVRASLGFRPFRDHGFEIMGGYTLASLGGGVSARAAVEATSGISVPAEIPDAEIQLRTTIHSVHASLGWRWLIGDHVVVRASLAYLQTVASSTRLAVPAAVAVIPAVASRVDQVSQAVDTTLNDKLTTYARLPVMGLSLGYRF